MSKNVRTHVLIGAAAAVMTLGLLGCNGEDEAVVPEPAAPQSTAPPARQTTPPQAPVDGAGASGAAAPTADDEPAPEPQAAQPPPTETTPPPTQSQPPAPRPQQQQQQPPQQPQQQAPPVAAANTPQAKARALLDQLLVQKGQAKWAEGERTLQELEKLKGTLPKEMRDEIEAERASFRAAKAIWGQDR